LALASGQVIAQREGSTAFVGALFELPSPAFKVEQTFAELVGGPLIFDTAGVSKRDIRFYVPPGSPIGADATLDLAFSHAQTLDFLRSGIVVRLNGVSVGSIRLSDVSSNLNTVRLILPSSALRSGVNMLEIQVEITARDACADWRNGALFVSIFPDSRLRLPPSGAPILPLRNADLGAFPAPFAESELSGTTFVVPSDDVESWIAAGRLAFALGSQSAGLRAPGVQVIAPGDGFVPEAGDYIVIGQPGRAPAIADLAAVLPAPFAPDGQIAPAVQSQIGYNIDASRSAGFLQVAVLQGGASTVLLVAGNNSQGLDWASQVLTDHSALQRMAGANVAVLQSRANPKPFRVAAADQAASPAPGAVGEGPGETPRGADTSSTLPPRQDVWAFPVLIASLAALAALAVAEVRSWKKR
ncbi:MAG: cellulose biosynthesis cyclic di-GMP-binding regulatory protein BcsB, partial [Anaerolineales bacterium]